MSTFTQEKQRDSLSVNSVFVKVDIKGRISIPSFLRKNFGLKKGSEVTLVFDLKSDGFFLKIDQEGGYER